MPSPFWRRLLGQASNDPLRLLLRDSALALLWLLLLAMFNRSEGTLILSIFPYLFPVLFMALRYGLSFGLLFSALASVAAIPAGYIGSHALVEVVRACLLTALKLSCFAALALVGKGMARDRNTR